MPVDSEFLHLFKSLVRPDFPYKEIQPPSLASTTCVVAVFLQVLFPTADTSLSTSWEFLFLSFMLLPTVQTMEPQDCIISLSLFYLPDSFELTLCNFFSPAIVLTFFPWIMKLLLIFGGTFAVRTASLNNLTLSLKSDIPQIILSLIRDSIMFPKLHMNVYVFSSVM